jgi:hypothetical protein
VWWALGFSVVTTVGLGVLVWGILIVDLIGYGAAAVMMPETTPTAPEDAPYGLAFAVGVVVNVVCASALARLAFRTPVRTWPPAVQGLAAALTAGLTAVCALLLTLGINPVGFVIRL